MKKFLFLSIFFLQFSSSIFSQDPGDWEWVHPKPTGLTYYAIQRINSTTWYFAGLFGTFIKTTDSGVSWKYNNKAGKINTSTGIASTVYGIYFFDANNGIAVGGTAAILKTTDAGESWNPVPGNPLTDTRNLYSVSFVDNQTGFITGASGTFLKSTDGGNNWTLINIGTTAVSYASWSPDGNLILAVTNNGQIKRSTDGGTNWSTINTTPSFNITKISGTVNNLFIAGAGGNVQRSTNGGVNWTSVNSGIPSTAGFNDIDVAGGKIYLTGPADVVYKSTNSGTSWSTISLTTPETTLLLSRMVLDTSPDGDTIFIGSGFGIILSKQGAAAPVISHSNIMTIATVNDIWASKDGKNIIFAHNFNETQFQRSTNYGDTWTSGLVKPGSTLSMTAIQMLDTLNGFMGGTSGNLFKTTNGGVSWDSVNTASTNSVGQIKKVSFISPTTGWIFFTASAPPAGTIYKTTDGGNNWVRQPLGVIPEPNIASAFVVDSLNAWVSGSLGVFKTTNGGTSWAKDSVEGPLNPFTDIKMVDATIGYGVGAVGKVYKTTNGGTLWQLIYSHPQSINLSTLQVVNPNFVVVFGANGAVLSTTDGGVTWLTKSLNATAALNSFHTYNPVTNTLTIYACCQNGFLLKNTISILPIELTGFSVSGLGRDVVLNWTTATELNNRGFEVQRKKTGGDWESLSFINGKGTSTKTSEYKFVDKTPGEGKFSYRLKQIDYDGSTWTSYSVDVEIGNPMEFELSQNFPNPFNPSTVIRFALPEAGVTTLKVYNSAGEEVATLFNEYLETGTHSIKFDASKLSSGIYFYKLESGKFSAVKKMSLIK